MDEPQPGARLAKQTHALATLLLVIFFGLLLYQMITVTDGTHNAGWPLAGLLLLAALSSLTAMARKLPWQYVLSAAFICALFGSLAHLCSLNSGIPFGPFMFGPAAGWRFFGKLPWTIPVLWIVVVFTSRGVGRLILKPWRKMKTYGFWLIGLTVALVVLLDLGLDPFLARLGHYWLWSPTKLRVTWAGAPLINFPGWGVVTLLILAFSTPLLIKKQPGQNRSPDYHPLGLWVGAMVLFAVAAAKHELWGPAGLDALAVVAVTLPAIRGGRW